MSKDRLEDIKQAYGYGCDLPEDTYPFWLIERVQELDKALTIENRLHVKANEDANRLDEQVSRYREALKKIAVNFPFDSIEDYVKIACQALEESE